MTTCLIIGFAVLLYASYRVYQHFFPTPNINPNEKYVLISGCDIVNCYDFFNSL